MYMSAVCLPAIGPLLVTSTDTTSVLRAFCESDVREMLSAEYSNFEYERPVPKGHSSWITCG